MATPKKVETKLADAIQADAPASDKKSWVPTRKWGIQVVGMLTALGLMYITTGTWDQEESIALVTLAGTAITNYLTPNASDNTNSP